MARATTITALGLVLLAASAGHAAGPSFGPGKPLLLHGGPVDPLRAPAPVPVLRHQRVQVVQARGTARRLLDRLRDRGCRVLGYLPRDAYIVLLPADDALEGMEGIRWHGAMRPCWKLAGELLRPGDHEARQLQVIAHRGLSLGGLARTLGEAGDVRRTWRGGARVRVAPGRLQQALDIISAMERVAWVEPVPRVVLTNDDSAWVIQNGEVRQTSTPLFDRGLTGEGEIIAVADSGLDTDACQFRFDAEASSQTLYNQTQAPEANVTDPDGKVISYYLQDGATPYDDRAKQGHGTYVAGCALGDNHAHLAADGDAGRDPQDGMAPAARLVMQDIGNRDGEQVLPDPLTDLFLQAYRSGARIHNNSYGQANIDTGYKAAAVNVDEAAWGLQDLLIIYSAGNEGPGSGTLVGMGTTSKNAVVVGASLPGSDNWGYGVCSFTSQGPTADGRLRPDLVAPGAVFSAMETEWIEQGGADIYGRPQADSTTDPPNDNCQVASSLRTGTSYAAPLVAGGAALVREYFVKGYHPLGTPDPGRGFEPSAALVKAVLVNSALSIGPGPNSMPGPFRDCETGTNLGTMEAAPNNIEGWGVVRLDRTLHFEGDPERLAVLTDTWCDGTDRGAMRRSPIEEGRVDTFGLEGVGTSMQLRVTLVWTDPAASVGAGKALVNDLDLEVVDAAGRIFRGNVAMLDNRSRPAGSTPSDDRNPVEQVFLEVEDVQDIVIRVVGRHLPGNGRTDPFPSTRQGYALIATGDFAGVCPDGPCGGQVDAGVDAGADAGPADDGAGDAGGDPGRQDAGAGDPGEAGDGQGADPDERIREGRIQGACGCAGGEGDADRAAFWLLAGIAWARLRRHGAC